MQKQSGEGEPVLSKTTTLELEVDRHDDQRARVFITEATRRDRQEMGDVD